MASTYVPSDQEFKGIDLIDVPDIEAIFDEEPDYLMEEKDTWDAMPSSKSWGDAPQADVAQAELNEEWDAAPSREYWGDNEDVLVDVGSNIPGEDLPNGDLYSTDSYKLSENTDEYTQVGDISTVAEELNALIDSDSDYMRLARTKALEGMNARGLLNSSMAIGASQRAAIDAALPIAQQDAKMRQEWRGRLADYMHEQKMTNASMSHDMLKQRAMDEASWDQFITNMTHEQMLANSDTLRQLEMQSRQLGHDWDADQYAALNQRILANLDAETRTNLANLEAETQIEMQERDLAASWDSQNLNNLHETMMANASMEHELTMQERDLMASWFTHLTQIDAGLVAQEIEVVAENIIKQMDISNEQYIAALEMTNNVMDSTVEAWQTINSQKWLKPEQREQLLTELLNIQGSNLNMVADITGMTIDWGEMAPDAAATAPAATTPTTPTYVPEGYDGQTYSDIMASLGISP